MKRIHAYCLLLATAIAVNLSPAQFIEDALRLSTSGPGLGARSLGLGSAYTGIAEDFTAIYWNPAGLAQSSMSQFSFGLSNNSFGNTSSFYGLDQSLSTSSTTLNNLGLIYAVPTSQGSLVLALGYGRNSDFTTGLSFRGFNPSSSIIQAYAPDGQTTSDPAGNTAWELYMANADSLSPNLFRWDSKIMDSVTQSGKVIEGGGLNYFALAGAVEAARNLYLGLTLNFVSGSYSYTRNYSEEDLRDVYDASRFPFDFSSFSLLETVESDISGFNAKAGFLYRLSPEVRIGMAIKTPSWLTVRETFSSIGESHFDNGDAYQYPAGNVSPSRNEYDVRTPFVLSAGLAWEIRNLMFTGDVEFTDWTQMEFKDPGGSFTDFSSHLQNLNSRIKTDFQPTANLRGGLEFRFPDAEMRLRGGFAYLPSPYQIDAAANAQKYVTAGIGFDVEKVFAIDLGYAHGFWETSHVNYDAYDVNGKALSGTSEQIRTNGFTASVAYRF